MLARTFLVAIAVAGLAACASESSPSPTAAGDAGPIADAAPADAAPPVDSGAPPKDRGAAARAAAEGDPACLAITPFYWEIGDGAAKLASGSVPGGGAPVDGDTAMLVASASKWLYGAYVTQTASGPLSPAAEAALRMRAGATNFDGCPSAATAPRGTVADCCAAKGTSGGTNCDVVAGDVGEFSYGGGHFQALAANDATLGSLPPGLLAAAMERALGVPGLTYANVGLAGGVRTSAKVYATFLQRLLRRDLALGASLGAGAVCTLPGSCAEALASPVPLAWHYAAGHWVEDDPSGDGAFSSPGAFGFYPWIDKGRTTYGVLARVDVTPASGGVATTAYWKSVLCGQAIRRAWFTP